MEKESLLTFSRLYILHRFNIQALGAQADVPLSEVDKMLLDQPISRETARKVLKALSLLTGQYYTFSNVKVLLIDEEGEATITS